MKAGLPHSSNSGAASVELNHPKACSFSHGAMQNLGGGELKCLGAGQIALQSG